MHHIYLHNGMRVVNTACHSAHVFAINQYRDSQRLNELFGESDGLSRAVETFMAGVTIIVHNCATKRPCSR